MIDKEVIRGKSSERETVNESEEALLRHKINSLHGDRFTLAHEAAKRREVPVGAVVVHQDPRRGSLQLWGSLQLERDDE